MIGLRGVALDITDRKLAEENARQTEERNSAIVTAIPDLMFVQTRDGVYLDYHANTPDDHARRASARLSGKVCRRF